MNVVLTFRSLLFS